MFAMLGRWATVAVFALTAMGSLALNGCAQDVGLIDRVQPGALPKALFSGDWYLQRTVIDAPYTAGFTFIGEADALQRIRWQIQEDHLVAYRAYDFVAGTDRAHSRSGKPGATGSAGESGQPVAIYAITRHFDIIRGYSAATGEQDNVLQENAQDRPWYQRGYVRVDWSRNLAPGKGFDFTVDSVRTEPVAFSITNPADPDAFTVAWRDASKKSGWRETRDPAVHRDAKDAEYFDVVSKLYATPEEYAGWDDWGPWSVPVCWFYGNEDCQPAEVTIRTSLRRVDPKDDYEALEYPDNYLARNADGSLVRTRVFADGSVAQDPDGEPVRIPMFDKFGYFRAERPGYDELHGEVESARRLLISRWNLWDKSLDAAGKPIPYPQRKVRPVVYYKSIGFPAELKEAAEKMRVQWDTAFAQTVATLQGKDAKAVGAVFELRDNTFQVDAAGKVIDRGQRVGDLRYSLLSYVAKPTRAGLLGYGPSSTDPLTGQIIHAGAHIYGGGHKVLATSARDLVRLVRGEITPEEYGLGHVTEQEVKKALAQYSGTPASNKGLGANAPGEEQELRTPGSEAHQKAVQDAQEFAARSTNRDKQKAVHAMKKSALAEKSGWAEKRLGLLDDSPLLSNLVNRDIALAHGDPQLKKALASSPPGVPLPALSKQQLASLSPSRWAPLSARARLLQRDKLLGSHSITLASFVDDAVMGLAEQYKDKSTDELWPLLFARIFASTAEHEVGHTLGLRHNFEGSFDALNYHDHYWDLRGENGKPLEDPTLEQRKAGMDDYKYSSIMDYAQRVHSDLQGLGKYDLAAIAFGYGQLVEVFDAAPADPIAINPPQFNPYKADQVDGYHVFAPLYRDPLRAVVQHGLRHYTEMPKVMGGVQKMRARKFIPYGQVVAEMVGQGSTPDQPKKRTLWEVPYRFCSDEYAEGTPSCNRFDAGADSAELLRTGLQQYRDHYLLQAFRRDRVGFSIGDYEGRLWGHYFLPIALQYQNWVFQQYDPDVALNPGVLWDWLTWDPSLVKQYSLESKPWAEALGGGLSMSAAVKEGVEALANVIGQPEPGQYCLDKSTNQFRQYSYVTQTGAGLPLPQCTTPQGCDGTAACVDLIIPIGQGRLYESEYDHDTGYYFYERLRHVGSFYDKINAIIALTDPSTYFIGVDSSQPINNYLLSMGIFFNKELGRLFGGMAAGRNDVVGWMRNPQGKVVSRSWFDPKAQAKEASWQAIDVPGMFILRNYAIYFGMAWLPANWDQTFVDSMEIFLEGSGAAFKPKAGALVATFVSPTNTKVYKAAQLSDPSQYSPAYVMLQDAQQLADRLAGGDKDIYPWMVDEAQQIIEIARGMYDVFGKAIF